MGSETPTTPLLPRLVLPSLPDTTAEDAASPCPGTDGKTQHRLVCYVTEDQKRALQRRARLAGISSLSFFMLQMLLNGEVVNRRANRFAPLFLESRVALKTWLDNGGKTTTPEEAYTFEETVRTLVGTIEDWIEAMTDNRKA